MNIRAIWQASKDEHDEVLQRLDQQQASEIEAAIEVVVKTLQSGNCIYLCGNGGSAADCQHIAAELVGRFELQRLGLPAIALTTDSSALTAIGNDFGFEQIFVRQFKALAKSGDLLWAYSTSGESANILAALEQARELACQSMVMTGSGPNSAAALADLAICVPSKSTARIQEMHLLLGHVICQAVDKAVSEAWM